MKSGLGHSFAIGTAIFSTLGCGTAMAQCMATGTAGAGFTPISISATEASTAQVMELVRRRRDATMTQPTVAAEATPVAAPAPAAPSSTAAPRRRPAAAAAPAPARPGPRSAAVRAPAAAAPVSIKDEEAAPFDDIYPMESVETARHGVWARIYGDYEKREKLSLDPGDDSDGDSQTRTFGVLAGKDWSVHSNLRLGLFGGYQSSKTKYSDGSFATTVVESEISFPATVTRTDTEQETEGGIFGLYGSYVRNRWTVDLLLKADIFSSEKTETISFSVDCPDPAVRTPVARHENLDFVNYIAQSDFSYRIDIDEPQIASVNSHVHWLEPFVGFRYTYTDYTSASGDRIDFAPVGSSSRAINSGPVDLDTENGHVLRLHGGLRLRSIWLQDGDRAISTTLTGMLYSDVIVDGLVVGTGGGAAVADDEGKLRALGAFQITGDLGDGLSLTTQVEVRGGEDYFGFGGQAGIRYRW